MKPGLAELLAESGGRNLSATKDIEGAVNASRRDFLWWWRHPSEEDGGFFPALTRILLRANSIGRAPGAPSPSTTWS